MEKTRFSVGNFRRALWVRGLSYVLLFLFVYASTAEAVHTHGNNLPAASAITNVNVADSSEGSTSTKHTSNSGECVVCQFQQSLSSAVLYTPLLLLAPQEFHNVASFATAQHTSAAINTQQGRAPPFTF